MDLLTSSSSSTEEVGSSVRSNIDSVKDTIKCLNQLGMSMGWIPSFYVIGSSGRGTSFSYLGQNEACPDRLAARLLPAEL